MGHKSTGRTIEPLEARLPIEPYLAYLGARRYGSLGRLPAPRTGLAGPPTAPAVVYGTRFHLQLAFWSGSGVFVHVLSSLLRPVSPESSIISNCDRGSSSEQDQNSIYAAVVAGDAELACDQAEAHLQRLRSLVGRLPAPHDSPRLIPLGLVGPSGAAHDLTGTRAAQLVKASKFN